MKKRAEENNNMMDSLEEVKKKMARDYEVAQQKAEVLEDEVDKLTKSKKKLQSEVDDLNVEIDNNRSQFTALEKRQRKFDQNLAEEKAISERWVYVSIDHISLWRLTPRLWWLQCISNGVTGQFCNKPST